MAFGSGYYMSEMKPVLYLMRYTYLQVAFLLLLLLCVLLCADIINKILGYWLCMVCIVSVWPVDRKEKKEKNEPEQDDD